MLLALSFLSGAAGLVYEALWARRLALVFGSTALAQTLTLAAFLAGLAAGSLLLGRACDRAALPLRFYARLEWGIGLAALAAPPLLALPLGAARALAPLLLLVQAFVIGGTLPALCRAAGGEAQASVGRVYAVNAAGAAAGCLAAGFWLLPALGLSLSFPAAAALNAGLGVWARLARAAPSVKAQRPAGPSGDAPRGLVLGAVFLSGCAALACEVAWTRLLALALGSSAYSFCDMLAALIAGLAVGSAAAARPSLRRARPALALGWALTGAGLTLLLLLPVYGRLALYDARLRLLFGTSARDFYAFEAAKLALCLAALLPPSACLGAVLPLAARLASTGGRGRGESVGEVLCANTAGNVLGAFAGFWLLTPLGIEGLLKAGTTVFAAAGAALLWSSSAGRPRRAAWAAAAALAWVGLRASLPGWDMRLLCQGLYRAPWLTPGDLDVDLRRSRLLYYREDREASVAVLEDPGGQRSLRVNGKADASTGGDMRTQIELGELPLLLDPEAARALVIGFGSGVTAGSMLRHPLARLDAVELLPGVARGSAFFRAHNGEPLSDPRLALSIEDAKTFLGRPGPLYDVIVSEPSNPWMAGVGDLFSRQFYARAAARLAPDGLMVQWFHVYEMDDDLLRLVARTFRASFPHVAVWSSRGSDLLLVGSRRPLAPDFAALERRWGAPGVREDMERMAVSFPSTLLAEQAAGEATAAALGGEGPLADELRPVLEYEAPKAFFRETRASAIYALDDRADPARRRELLLARYLAWRGRPLGSLEYADRFLDGLDVPRERGRIVELLADWGRRYPRDPRLARARGDFERLAR